MICVDVQYVKYFEIGKMYILSRTVSGGLAPWYKSFGSLNQVKVFLSTTKMIKANLILVEIPSYKEISLDELEKAV